MNKIYYGKKARKYPKLFPGDYVMVKDGNRWYALFKSGETQELSDRGEVYESYVEKDAWLAFPSNPFE